MTSADDFCRKEEPTMKTGVVIAVVAVVAVVVVAAIIIKKRKG